MTIDDVIEQFRDGDEGDRMDLFFVHRELRPVFAEVAPVDPRPGRGSAWAAFMRRLANRPRGH